MLETNLARSDHQCPRHVWRRAVGTGNVWEAPPRRRPGESRAEQYVRTRRECSVKDGECFRLDDGLMMCEISPYQRRHYRGYWSQWLGCGRTQPCRTHWQATTRPSRVCWQLLRKPARCRDWDEAWSDLICPAPTCSLISLLQTTIAVLIGFESMIWVESYKLTFLGRYIFL